MSEELPELPVFETLVAEGMKFSRVAERIYATLVILQVGGEFLSALAELDNELAPEVDAAIGHVEKAVAALSRAQDVAKVKLDVALGGDE